MSDIISITDIIEDHASIDTRVLQKYKEQLLEHVMQPVSYSNLATEAVMKLDLVDEDVSRLSIAIERSTNSRYKLNMFTVLSKYRHIDHEQIYSLLHMIGDPLPHDMRAVSAIFHHCKYFTSTRLFIKLREYLLRNVGISKFDIIYMLWNISKVCADTALLDLANKISSECHHDTLVKMSILKIVDNFSSH